MAATNNKVATYPSASALTVTNLHSLASAASLDAGWESNEVDNTTNLYFDYIVSGNIKVNNTTPITANTFVEVWVVPVQGDSTYPDVFDGTESTETLTHRDMIFSMAGLLATIRCTATTTGRVYPFVGSVMAALPGWLECPPKFVIFITHNTGQALHSATNNVSVKGVFSTSGG